MGDRLTPGIAEPPLAWYTTAAEFQKAMDRSGESPMSLLLEIFEIALKNPTAIDDRELEKIDIWAVLTRERRGWTGRLSPAPSRPAQS